MAELARAREPFRFCTRLHLSELTGLRAATLGQLLAWIKQVPGSCIYHHTHRFLQQHQFFSPEPPNDFAYWITEVLKEDELGERLASIDIMQFAAISSLRERLAKTIGAYLDSNPLSNLKFCRSGEEFHFIKTVSFVIPTSYLVYDLAQFSRALEKVTIDSIYFHVFEARLRLERQSNDFSDWISNSLGDKTLAQELAKFDPYTMTLEDLRRALVSIVNRRLLS